LANNNSTSISSFFSFKLTSDSLFQLIDKILKFRLKLFKLLKLLRKKSSIKMKRENGDENGAVENSNVCNIIG
jgi:hypothetical protein